MTAVGCQSLQNLLPCRWPEELSAQLPPNGAADGNAGTPTRGRIAIVRCLRTGSWRLSHEPLEFEIIAAGTTDLDTVIARRTFASRTDQRAHAIGLVADSIQRLKTGNFGIEFGFGVLVEELKRPLRAFIPIAVDLPRIAANPFQMGLQQSRDVSLADFRRGRG